MIFRIKYVLILCVCLSVGLFVTNIIGAGYAAQKNSEEESLKEVPDTIDGKVSTSISVPGYTYVEVDTGSDKVWAAVPGTSVNIGDKVSFSIGIPMQNFYSKTLQRNFSVIYFVDHFVTDDGITQMSASAAAAHGRPSQNPATELIEEINKVEGGNTIAEIYAAKDKLNGETISVRGKVTRFTASVLGKNWIHIRDSSTTDDLTVTTAATAAINDIVIIEGKLELDKDYGYGYVYPVILEEAKITKD